MEFLSDDKIRVMVVDDSAFMRSAIKGMLNGDPDIEVIATARDGQEAVEKAERLHPDAITMDLEMPRMDGLSAIKAIMERNPTPILVVSSLTTDSAEATLKALELGAMDFVCKDLQTRSMNILNLEEMLRAKIRQIAKKKVKHFHPRTYLDKPPIAMPVFDSGRMQNVAVVAIGTSTGGPKALQEVIPFLPKDFIVPVMVVQHMPVLFTKPFAERLDSISQLNVKEAENGDVIEAGNVYIARGGVHMKAKRINSFKSEIILDPEPENILYHPSVNVMMFSCLETFGGRILGVIMTGMGDDGTQGLKAIKQAGGKSIAQNEETCVVYGMPKMAVEAGAVDKVVPLQNIANEIVNMV